MAGVRRWLLSSKELAEFLGVAESTIQRHHVSGKLPPAVKLGHRRMWRAAEIRDWIRAGCPPGNRWKWGEEGYCNNARCSDI